ncbi:MAG: LexA family transcriptional regulator [Caenibius sp.]
MAEVIGCRVAKLIEQMRSNQSAIARASGMTQPSIARLISGETRETGKLIELARALGTTPEYLIGETDDPAPGALGEQRLGWHAQANDTGSDHSAIMMIRQIDLHYGAGATYLDHHVEENMGAFPRMWVRQFTDAPAEKLVWTRVKGDSMSPTINDGEPILIDQRQVSLDDGDLIWAFAYGETGMVKRLRPHPDGRVEMMSDNQNVSSAIAVDGELHLVGRVVAVLKKT